VDSGTKGHWTTIKSPVRTMLPCTGNASGLVSAFFVIRQSLQIVSN
jgi:hypothetical protein